MLTYLGQVYNIYDAISISIPVKIWSPGAPIRRQYGEIFKVNRIYAVNISCITLALVTDIISV